MAWLRSIAIGLGVGAIASVTPFELSALAIAAVFFSVWSPIEEARKGPALAPLRHAALRFSLLVAIVTIAMQLPFKHLDQKTSLESPCVTLAAAAKAARWRSDGLPQTIRERQVCLPSVTPTLRQIQSVFEESGVSARVGYCGNGATLLFGAHPIGGALLKVKD